MFVESVLKSRLNEVDFMEKLVHEQKVEIELEIP